MLLLKVRFKLDEVDRRLDEFGRTRDACLPRTRRAPIPKVKLDIDLSDLLEGRRKVFETGLLHTVDCSVAVERILQRNASLTIGTQVGGGEFASRKDDIALEIRRLN